MRAMPRRWTAGNRRETFARRLSAPIAAASGRMAEEMDFTFLLDRSPRTLLDRVSPFGRNAGPRPLRPARVGGAAGELRRDRARGGAGRALVPPEPSPDSRRPRFGADVLVRIDVRVPDAGSGARGARPAACSSSPTALPCGARFDTERSAEFPGESPRPAYNAWDVHFTYQYSNFGVSGLGLKRGLSEDLVVAPYATALAAMVEPAARAGELRAPGGDRRAGPVRLLRVDRLHDVAAPRGRVLRGREGLHGPPPGDDDRGPGERAARIDDAPPILPPIRAVQATDLLLQERTPSTVAVARPVSEAGARAPPSVRDHVPPGACAAFVPSRSDAPHASAVQRPVLRHDDGRGIGLQPLAGSRRDAMARGHHLRFVGNLRVPDRRRVGEDLVRRVSTGRDRGRCLRGDLFGGPRRDPSTGRADATSLQILVSTEDDAEMRRISLTNSAVRAREIEITSYMEVVLARPEADAAHPAFSNLFVQTEFVPATEALLAGRRRRGPRTPVSVVCRFGRPSG